MTAIIRDMCYMYFIVHALLAFEIVMCYFSFMFHNKIISNWCNKAASEYILIKHYITKTKAVVCIPSEVIKN